MPDGRGLYNLGGGQITPVSQQRQILPIGEATRRRQMMTGRVLPGEINWGEEGGGGGGNSSGFNILDLLKGIVGTPFGLLSGLFGGDEGRFGLQGGRTSPENRLTARNRPFSQYDRDYY